MRVDEDGGAVWFVPDDQAALTAKLYSVLNAAAVEPEPLVWVRRVEIVSPEGSFPLFHDEDGTSHVELHHLEELPRQRIISLLQAGL